MSEPDYTLDIVNVDAFVREIESNNDIEALSNMSEELAREILVSESTARELKNKATILVSEAGALKSRAAILASEAAALKMKRKIVLKRLMKLGA